METKGGACGHEISVGNFVPCGTRLRSRVPSIFLSSHVEWLLLRLYWFNLIVCVLISCVYFVCVCPVFLEPVAGSPFWIPPNSFRKSRGLAAIFVCPSPTYSVFVPFVFMLLAGNQQLVRQIHRLIQPVCFLYFPSVTSVVWQHLVHRPGIRIPARRPLPRGRRYYWPSKERLPSSTTISSRCPAVVDAKVPRGRIRSSLLIVSGSRKLASCQFPFQSPRSSTRTTATHILLYLNFH